MDWSGERFEPGAGDAQLWYEHAHRYVLAAGLSTGRRVLDLGCGQGYGSAMLARTAASVIGVDLDAEVVARANHTYAAPGLRFAVADASALLLPDNSIDLVVCFEVIEHVHDPGRILDEVARILAPDGIAVLSTPDAADSDGDNPFHFHELTGPELVSELGKRFAHQQMFGQRVTAMSTLWPISVDDDPMDPASALTIGNPLQQLEMTPGGGGLDGFREVSAAPVPRYLVAVCSQTPLTDLQLPGPVSLLDPSDELLTDLRGQLARANQQLGTYERELELRASTLANADADVERARTQLAAYESELELKSADLENQAKVISELTLHSGAAEQARRLEEELRQAKARQNSLLEQAQQRARALKIAQNVADAAQRELISERTSLAGQILGNYRRWVETSLPPRTLRRRTYNGVHRTARRLVRRRVPATVALSGTTTAMPKISPFTIQLTPEQQPQVSIIIPAYGKPDLTLRCLASIVAAPTAVPYEVIVVDDASPDGSGSILAAVQGIVLIQNSTNAGYLRSTNIGAARARGEFVLLLNNDTEVTPGWLDALVAAAADPSVGAVGAGLHYPDGTLQEAGGIVFADGTAWNFGRHHSPQDCRYRNRREVDYCSAACLLVRRSAWESLAGFDPLFEPAYYEDTDLCFRLREISLSVVFEPEAVVIHHEGGTHGTDETELGRRLRESSHAKFLARWQHVIVRQQPAGAVFRARRRGPSRSVLVIDHRLPTPDRDSGSVRMRQWLLLLQAAGRDVCFIPQNGTLFPHYAQPLRDAGIEVFLPGPDIQDLLDELAAEVDLVILSRPDIAADYLPRIRISMPEAVIAYDMVDFHAVREQRRTLLGAREHRGQHFKDQNLTDLERLMLGEADVVVAISAPEAEQVRALLPGTPVVTIPNIHDEHPAATDFKSRSGFVFVGGFDHPPNRDAVHHLVEQIWPLIRQALPTAELHLVGSQMPADIAGLSGSGVVVHGWLPDLTPVLSSARVFLAPLRYGAGLKGKIGQAMGLGIPVVTTSIGAEGMSAAPLVISDDESEFAREAVALHSDADRWNQQAQAAATYIHDIFSPAAVTPMVAEFLTTADRVTHHGSRAEVRTSANRKSTK